MQARLTGDGGIPNRGAARCGGRHRNGHRGDRILEAVHDHIQRGPTRTVDWLPRRTHRAIHAEHNAPSHPGGPYTDPCVYIMQARWQETVASLTEAQRNVIGDTVVAAGTIAYSGPFTPTFRTDLLAQWTGRLAELSVPFTRNTTLIRTLEDPVQTRAWTLQGLPTDVVSVENGTCPCPAQAFHSRPW
jgi:hypothetical protein